MIARLSVIDICLHAQVTVLNAGAPLAILVQQTINYKEINLNC